MTSDDPRDRSRDELASALLDGVLPPGEAEAARRDPGVMDRAAALTAARDALRASPLAPADPAARERALTRALAEFDAEGAVGQARHGPRPDVVHLRSRRRGGAGGSAARWLGVAAAVLVLAGIAGIAVSREDDGDQAGTTASADLESAPEAAEAPATSGAGDRAADSQSEGGAAMAPTPVEVGDLGG
ncbi:MAG TPA: hypothetical protein VFI47_23515, partial [Acidimicrobiales bacterium]|nr:hypothetical protein [Acidimicrobiales bacterium]